MSNKKINLDQDYSFFIGTYTDLNALPTSPIRQITFDLLVESVNVIGGNRYWKFSNSRC